MNYNQDTTPAVCEHCLGDNPYVEMTRERNGAQCKICTRPFTVFRWTRASGSSKSSAKTVICLTCARAKNCCQSCMLDLQLGIDLNTRDQLLKIAGVRGEEDVVHHAQNEISRIYNANQLERRFESQKVDPAKRVEGIIRGIETAVAKGEKIKKPETHMTTKVSKADLVKLCKNLPFNGTLSSVPKNEQIRSFFLFGVGDETPNYAVERYFGSLVDEKVVEAAFVNTRGRFGYVQFRSRKEAERVAAIIQEKHKGYTKPCLELIEKTPVRVCWAGKTTTGSYSSSDLEKIASIVRQQMVRLSRDDKTNKAVKRSRGESRTVKKRQTKAVYSTLSEDYEI